MLTRVDIHNYRSIYRASVPLSPFTLLIGANGTGKTNLLRLLREASEVSQNIRSNKAKGDVRTALSAGKQVSYPVSLPMDSTHYLYQQETQSIVFYNDKGEVQRIEGNGSEPGIPELANVKVFSLDSEKAGMSESLASMPTIEDDGSGLIQVLDTLKTGDREDLFNLIEETFKQQIPDVEKLSFVPDQHTKSLQVREKHLPTPTPMKLLSEGTRLALMIAAILYQENNPSLVCIEDIERGLHPRLFQQIVELCFTLPEKRNGVQIIATTHNPYLVDEFKDRESAVIIVEKENGQTKFTTLEEKIGESDVDEIPLGSLWYSGAVGGVPQGV